MARKEFLRLVAEVGGKQLLDDIKSYERTIHRYDKQFASKKRRSSAWTVPGAVRKVDQYDRGVRLHTQTGQIEIHWVASDCLRVRTRLTDSDFPSLTSYAVCKADWPPVPFELAETPTTVEIYSNMLRCRVEKATSNIRLETLDGRLLCADKSGTHQHGDGRVRLSMRLQPDEIGLGTGARATNLNLRGKKVTLWNADVHDYQRGSDQTYHSIPFYLGVHNQGVYGMFWDNSSRGIIDIGASKADELSFEAESGAICYYLFGGDDVKQVVGRYTELTGRIPLPPLWTLGYHQGRFNCDSQESILKLAEDFRKHGLPCDSIFLDVCYMHQFRPFTWNKEKFPQFQSMIDTLHKQGFKVIAAINPGIKIDASDSVYRSGIEQDVFLKYPDGKFVIGVEWAGMCQFPDFTNPAARSWWSEQLKPLISAGVDGIWSQLSEPGIFTSEGVQTLPDYVAHDGDGTGGTHVEKHNVYGMQMGRATYEGLRDVKPKKRPFHLAQGGYAGAQRYATLWTGENSSDWNHLRLSISTALNMGLSGASMSGSVVGGYLGDANGELMTRWLQATCLMPFLYATTALNTHPQEPWSFGQPYEVINRLAIELRYKLMPYLYSVVAQCKEYGWPIVRPVFMAEPDNPAIRGIDDSYMLGDSLLVAPVLEAGAVRRSVYLPAGEWYDYWTNEVYQGGQRFDVPAPLERLPLFVRAGAVLPMWSERLSVQGYDPDALTYRVYPGEFETIQYEDSGEGFDYEEGNYRWIYITCGWDEGHFMIKRRIAGRFVPPYKTIKLEIVGFDEEPMQVRVDRQGAPLWFYDAGLIELSIDDFQQVEIIRRPLPSDRTLLRRPW